MVQKQPTHKLYLIFLLLFLTPSRTHLFKNIIVFFFQIDLLTVIYTVFNIFDFKKNQDKIEGFVKDLYRKTPRFSSGKN